MRKRGVIGTIFLVIKVCIGVAILLAILPRFNWDIFALVFWCFEKVKGWTMRLAEYIGNMEMFKNLFSMFIANL